MSESAPVRLVFLGGMAEVGKNILFLEHGDDIIVIDCGLAFPEEDQPGIDLVLADISYLKQNKDRIRGVFITHGHEDHIGAIPYLLPDLLPVTVWATKLTVGLITVKLDEAKLKNVDLREFDPDTVDPIAAGVFTVEPFRVCHSIPDSVGFAVTTPAGLMVFTGDFKFDETPIDGHETDFAKLASYGERGVRLLVTDCVHVEATGHTPSERVIGETYDEIFGKVDGRIFVATFASLIARIQQVIDTAAKHGRLVAPVGRSLENNVRIAKELGYLSDPERTLIEARDAAMLPDDRIVYVLTGAQGEPMAALSRLANGELRDVTLGEGDTVIVSATPIPGNETAVSRVIDKLFLAGAEVIYGRRALVHVSGHASQDELLRMLELTKPRDVVPTHGEPRHMVLYRDMAVEAGIPADHVHFLTNGDVLAVTPDAVARDGRVDAGVVYVDGTTVGEVGDVVVRDRRALARDGFVQVVIAVDDETGAVAAGPEIVTRGFVHTKESSELIEATKTKILDALGPTPGLSRDDEALNRQIRDTTSQFLSKETGRRPMVLPTVLRV